MAFAIPALAIAGAGITAMGAIEAGQATKNAAGYSAQVARNNKIITDQNADYAIAAGERQSEAVSLRGAEKTARIKTTQAANNIDVNTGSAVNVRTSQREADVLDTETTRNNAALKAYGYRAQGQNFLAESELDEAKGKQAEIGAAFKAAGGLLASASAVGGKWGAGGETGGFSGGDDLSLPPP